MNLINEAYQRLFPEKELTHATELNYNLRLADFNSNIRFSPYKIVINLNLQWKDIDDEIKIGLVQTLLLKAFKKKKNSSNINLYNNFIRNIPILTVKNRSDPILEESYARINAQFFSNQLEKPNLVWGRDSFRKLGSYNFHDDSITISTLFRAAPAEALDYIMYHELLHKQQKFSSKNGRSFFHTTEFREAERQYPNHELVEKEIQNIIKQSSVKKRSWFSSLFDF